MSAFCVHVYHGPLPKSNKLIATVMKLGAARADFQVASPAPSREGDGVQASFTYEEDAPDSAQRQTETSQEVQTLRMGHGQDTLRSIGIN